MDIRGQHGRRFVLRHAHRPHTGPYPICASRSGNVRHRCGAARNQGSTEGAQPPLNIFSLPLENCVGHNLKILNIVQKICAPLGKLFAPHGVPAGYGPGTEAVQPDPLCPWQGDSRRVGAGVGVESTEPRSVVQPLRFPMVIRPERRTSVVVVN